jgi:hypothetical protein
VSDRELGELTLMQTQCVWEQSATYSCVENVGILVDHYGLNKFKSKEDDSYRHIVRKLLSLIEPIAAQEQRRLYLVPIGTVETYIVRQALFAAVAQGLRAQHEGAKHNTRARDLRAWPHGEDTAGAEVRRRLQGRVQPDPLDDAKDKELALLSYERCASELQLQVSRRQAQSTSFVDSPTVQAVLRWLEN